MHRAGLRVSAGDSAGGGGGGGGGCKMLARSQTDLAVPLVGLQVAWRRCRPDRRLQLLRALRRPATIASSTSRGCGIAIMSSATLVAAPERHGAPEQGLFSGSCAGVPGVSLRLALCTAHSTALGLAHGIFSAAATVCRPKSHRRQHCLAASDTSGQTSGPCHQRCNPSGSLHRAVRPAGSPAVTFEPVRCSAASPAASCSLAASATSIAPVAESSGSSCQTPSRRRRPPTAAAHHRRRRRRRHLSPAMVSLAGLVEPPDQAGLLLKQGHSSSSWRQRFFILKVRPAGSVPAGGRAHRLSPPWRHLTILPPATPRRAPTYSTSRAGGMPTARASRSTASFRCAPQPARPGWQAAHGVQPGMLARSCLPACWPPSLIHPAPTHSLLPPRAFRENAKIETELPSSPDKRKSSKSEPACQLPPAVQRRRLALGGARPSQPGLQLAAWRDTRARATPATSRRCRRPPHHHHAAQLGGPLHQARLLRAGRAQRGGARRLGQRHVAGASSQPSRASRGLAEGVRPGSWRACLPIPASLPAPKPTRPPTHPPTRPPTHPPAHPPARPPATWQAAIPRADLVQHLQGAGKLADVLASYAHNVQVGVGVGWGAVVGFGVGKGEGLRSGGAELMHASSPAPASLPCRPLLPHTTHPPIHPPTPGLLPRGRRGGAVHGRPCPHACGDQRGRRGGGHPAAQARGGAGRPQPGGPPAAAWLHRPVGLLPCWPALAALLQHAVRRGASCARGLR